eukprot:CAMPEP_0194027048 /NCGR_PEP_ID=MMETSP0009_2-20130614/1281_1 /TAXON_ID=210454 /ORGANISM="Grammatophora oceanica, Strain CCMP 410" /LENGTH=78 /DNA_ID=CAMNT_0038665991 /DNA_START=31 /DNA_END=267 /DNA_ORIENTATION=-
MTKQRQPSKPRVVARGPMIAMTFACSLAFGAVYYAHSSAEESRKAMRAGVERDKLRLKLKRQRKKEEEAAAAAKEETK